MQSEFMMTPFTLSKRDLERVNSNPLELHLYTYNETSQWTRLKRHSIIFEGMFLFDTI